MVGGNTLRISSAIGETWSAVTHRHCAEHEKKLWIAGTQYEMISFLAARIFCQWLLDDQRVAGGCRKQHASQSV